MGYPEISSRVTKNPNNVSSKCPICSNYLSGWVVRDYWGNHYCKEHRDEYPICFICGRLLAPGVGGSGIHFSIDRYLCSVCNATAIDEKEQAKPIVREVGNWLLTRGLRFKNFILEIQISSPGSILKSKWGDKTSITGIGQGLVMGYIHRQTKMSSGGSPKRIVDGITILKGLPKNYFRGVVAHELGHAWLFLAHIDGLPLWMEEGFCNLLSYVVYKDQDTEESRYYIKILENDPNPIYGDGFRKVRSVFEKNGWSDTLKYLYKHKTLPNI